MVKTILNPQCIHLASWAQLEFFILSTATNLSWISFAGWIRCNVLPCNFDDHSRRKTCIASAVLNNLSNNAEYICIVQRFTGFAVEISSVLLIIDSISWIRQLQVGPERCYHHTLINREESRIRANVRIIQGDMTVDVNLQSNTRARKYNASSSARNEIQLHHFCMLG